MTRTIVDELEHRLESNARTRYADGLRFHKNICVTVERLWYDRFPVLSGSTCGFVRCTPPSARAHAAFMRRALEALWRELCKTFDVTKPVSIGALQADELFDVPFTELRVSAVGQLWDQRR